MMMTLAVMTQFFDVTGETGPEQEMVPQILEKWGCDAGSIRFLRASQNFILKFQKDAKDLVLRLSHGSERTGQGIQAELEYLRFLAAKGVAVHTPVASNAGREIETYESSMGTFYAVVFTYLQGEQVELETLDADGYFRWGEALGNLHLHSVGYQAERLSCFDQLTHARESLPPEETAALHELARLETWLNSRTRTERNFGLIHFDFELDNLKWHEGDDRPIQILDFDGCSYNWYAADIAYALRDLFEEGVDLTDPLFQAFLHGYRSRKEMDVSELEAIPMFLRLHQLIMYAKLLDVVKLDEGPEWAMNLKSRLEGKLQGIRDTLTFL